MSRYPYNPIEVLNSLKGHTEIKREVSLSNNLVHQHNRNVNLINDIRAESLGFLDKISKVKYLDLLNAAKDNYLNDSPTEDARYPTFQWYYREHMSFEKADPFSLSFNTPHQKHRFIYDLARYSRAYPIDTASILKSNIDEKREIVIDCLSYIAMAINATVELQYYVNCVDFYTSQFNDNPEILSNVSASLRNRLNIIEQISPNKHKAFKKIIASNPKYNDNGSIIPTSDSISDYGIRAIVLRQFQFDIKNKQFVPPEVAQQYISKLGLLKQSYFRLPVDLLASACSIGEISSYYDQLEPAEDYGMSYLLSNEQFKNYTIERREEMLSLNFQTQHNSVK